MLVVLNSYLGVKLRYKLSNEKQRFTFCPLVCSGPRLDGWKPYVISKCQGSRWCDRKFEIERKTFHKNGEAFELTRRIFPGFVVYSNAKAWSNQYIWEWEAQRLSIFLKKNYPGRRMALLGKV